MFGYSGETDGDEEMDTETEGGGGREEFSMT